MNIFSCHQICGRLEWFFSAWSYQSKTNNKEFLSVGERKKQIKIGTDVNIYSYIR
jgi:hypothetical protein